MKKIYLITHGEATHGVNKRVGGWFDSSLTEKGLEQARLVKKKLVDSGAIDDVKKVYSSDLKRCQQTSNEIFSGTQLPIVFDSRLREMSFGKHEGMDQNEHNKLIVPASPTGDRENHRICEGAESRGELFTRVESFIQDVYEKSDSSIAVVTHGFSASFVIAAFQKLKLDSSGYVSYRFEQGKYTVLVEDYLFKNRTLAYLNV
ncbi:histidine phosphatase family protein [Xenorhabdus stockiae]|uniref:histidine phosphatase family protein n=1 Tax=Xenorhabdus stockiae TaxID=351614 RepID=UPI00406396B2